MHRIAQFGSMLLLLSRGCKGCTQFYLIITVIDKGQPREGAFGGSEFDAQHRGDREDIMETG